MARRKAKQPNFNFSEFVTDPPVATALLAFALIALVLSILEFGSTLTF